MRNAEALNVFSWKYLLWKALWKTVLEKVRDKQAFMTFRCWSWSCASNGSGGLPHIPKVLVLTQSKRAFSLLSCENPPRYLHANKWFKIKGDATFEEHLTGTVVNAGLITAFKSSATLESVLIFHKIECVQLSCLSHWVDNYCMLGTFWRLQGSICIIVVF